MTHLTKKHRAFLDLISSRENGFPIEKLAAIFHISEKAIGERVYRIRKRAEAPIVFIRDGKVYDTLQNEHLMRREKA